LKKGDIVWNTYRGIFRIGKITRRFFKQDDNNKWAHFNVKWYVDDIYEDGMSWRKKLSGEDYTLKEYRGDQLKTLDPEHLKKVLEELERDK